MEAGIVLLYVLVVLNLPMWLSLFSTWSHCIQEVHGDLVGYFGSFQSRKAISISLPKVVLVVLFGPALAATLTILAAIGYSQGCMSHPQGSLHSVALAAVFGARVGDCVFSHWLLRVYKAPNPGIETTFLYAGEAALIAISIRWGAGEVVVSALAVAVFWLINPIVGLVSIQEKGDEK